MLTDRFKNILEVLGVAYFQSKGFKNIKRLFGVSSESKRKNKKEDKLIVKGQFKQFITLPDGRIAGIY